MGAPQDAADMGSDAKHLEAELQGKRPAQALDAAKVEADVAAARAAAAAGRSQEALDALLAVEKAARVAEDISATRQAVTALLQVRPRRLLVQGAPSSGGPGMAPLAPAPPGRRAAASPTPPSPRPHLLPHALIRFCTRPATGRACRSMSSCSPSAAAS